MKIRNTLVIFFSLWILLYLLTNPEIYCMENPYELIVNPESVTQICSNPIYNDSDKEIAKYLGELFRYRLSFGVFSMAKIVRICLEVCQETGIEADSRHERRRTGSVP